MKKKITVQQNRNNRSQRSLSDYLSSENKMIYAQIKIFGDFRVFSFSQKLTGNLNVFLVSSFLKLFKASKRTLFIEVKEFVGTGLDTTFSLSLSPLLLLSLKSAVSLLIFEITFRPLRDLGSLITGKQLSTLLICAIIKNFKVSMIIRICFTSTFPSRIQ